MTVLNYDPTTRSSLLLRLRDPRDDVSWTEFAAIYEPLVYRLAQRRGCQDADAREIVQDVLLAVSKAIDRFDPEAVGSFRGWLSTLARNATIDRFRRMSGIELTNSEAVNQLHNVASKTVLIEDALLDEFERGRREQLFRWAASKVRRRTGEVNWIAFWRTSVEGVPVDQVAEELNLSSGAVYVARCRILKRIRQLVATRWEE